MSHPFDTVVLSTSLDPKFSDFWPMVGNAWHRLFGVTVHLALVADACPLQPFEFSHIHYFKPVPNVPLSSQAKIARYYVASQLPDDTVVLTNDIDLMPLNTVF